MPSTPAIAALANPKNPNAESEAKAQKPSPQANPLRVTPIAEIQRDTAAVLPKSSKGAEPAPASCTQNHRTTEPQYRRDGHLLGRWWTHLPHSICAGNAEARIRELEAELQREREAAEANAKRHAEQVRELEARLAAVYEIASHHAKSKGVRFSPAEYRLLEACLHPDHVGDAAEKKKHEQAFKLLHERLPEKIFIDKKLAPRPAAPPLPRTVEELIAAGLRAKEERSARAKRAAAKRAQRDRRQIR